MAHSNARAFQSTFQVTLPDSGGSSERQYHSRRAHKKSRNGCVICKTRRVKCDERKPACRRCENYGATCIYPPSQSPASGSASSRTSSISSRTLSPLDTTLSSLSLSETGSKLRNTLASDLAFAPRIIGGQDTLLDMAANSLHFFLTNSTNTVGSPMIQAVMRREMIHVAFDNPYLMYTIIGCGILHMNRMNPDNEARDMAEAYFWQRALRLYSRALESPVTEKTVDGLISACMLMGITSLIPPKFEITDSWVFTGQPSDLNWLAIQGGLACILKVAGNLLGRSIWGVAFGRNRQDEDVLFRAHIQHGREGFHPQLADLCEITETTTADTNIYWYPLKLLSPYLELEANAQNAALCVTWMGRIDPCFVNLCRERDPRALVILAYWMGLMCSLSQWQQWIEGRIRKECIAVCIYLESLGDSSIRPFLDFPAAAAGYTLLDGL
ncbi:hypothetical protein BDV18DRAFT_140848 [Aspergillus unguis]